jgi:hypothetical protein
VTAPIAPIPADPKRISDFMLEHWEGLDGDAVRLHFVALCKALHRRLGGLAAIAQLEEVVAFVAEQSGLRTDTHRLDWLEIEDTSLEHMDVSGEPRHWLVGSFGGEAEPLGLGKTAREAIDEAMDAQEG